MSTEPTLDPDKLIALARAETGLTEFDEPDIAVPLRVLKRALREEARLTPKEVATHCVTDGLGSALLAQAATRMALSARAYHRVLKVARTIADLADAPYIEPRHIAEAVGYRGAAGR